jgi:hypothetical protein
MELLLKSSSVKDQDVLTDIYLKFKLFHAIRWFLISCPFLLTTIIHELLSEKLLSC